MGFVLKKLEIPRDEEELVLEQLVIPALDSGNSIRKLENSPCLPSLKLPDIVRLIINQKSSVQVKKLSRCDLQISLVPV